MFDQSMGAREVVTELVSHLNGDERLRKMLRGWPRSVLFDVEGERLVIRTADEGASILPDDGAAANMSFTMDHQTLLQIARDELAPVAGKMSGRIASTGSLIEILRFVSILTNTIKDYHRQTAGRL